ncbi:glycerophosphodiester phosphodiesterase family protein [Agrilutibacter solisilvae]|uniref:glycerophosphodiester phosphodiesterase n=1 Tax=Agrilutibacter solisilvae TaxID=2763317 RepID=A0A974Y057_9GAMM|nr:glycerophosphodiester phosphodiesterase family protein [Lysobacter solisilvae]QSX78138.1 hypothetical protein I8J32_015800 [Lysobacter solisilvae]
MTAASHAPDAHGLIVIGHRGASGYRPEHTLESYRLAIRQGADFIEPDLVATRDGVLVARHENEISGTTDVARHPRFAHLRTTKTVDGRSVTGWFTEDFTLAELRTLRARERIPDVRSANARFDGLYPIPTFAEIVRLARAHSSPHRRIGVYPETKHPTYFAREGRHIDGTPIGICLGAALIRTLVEEGFTDPAQVYIQSFEIENLLELQRTLMPAAGVRFPLVQLYGELASSMPHDLRWHLAQGDDLRAVYGTLVDAVGGGLGPATRYAHLATAPALDWLKKHYASGIGPWKGNLLPHGATVIVADGCGGVDVSSCHADRVHPMLADALALGLLVHPYTLRAEARYLNQTATGPQLVQGRSHAAVRPRGAGLFHRPARRGRRRARALPGARPCRPPRAVRPGSRLIQHVERFVDGFVDDLVEQGLAAEPPAPWATVHLFDVGAGPVEQLDEEQRHHRAEQRSQRTQDAHRPAQRAHAPRRAGGQRRLARATPAHRVDRQRDRARQPEQRQGHPGQHEVAQHAQDGRTGGRGSAWQGRSKCLPGL